METRLTRNERSDHGDCKGGSQTPMERPSARARSARAARCARDDGDHGDCEGGKLSSAAADYQSVRGSRPDATFSCIVSQATIAAIPSICEVLQPIDHRSGDQARGRARRARATFSCIFSGLCEKSKMLESMSTNRMDWACRVGVPQEMLKAGVAVDVGRQLVSKTDEKGGRWIRGGGEED